MKTPLKSYKKRFKSVSALKNMIPAGSTIESFLFFSGELEFNLLRDERLVRAHTDRYYISEFWSCVAENAERLFEIIASEKLVPPNNQVFNILQENWTSYRDPFIRAALFFILNNSSDTGLISIGNISYKKHNPFALSALRNFKPTEKFSLKFDSSFEDSLNMKYDADFVLIPVGQYTHNFLSGPRSAGYEMTPVNHSGLFKKFENTDDKWVMVYNYHPFILSRFKEHQVTMINNIGKITNNEKTCEEVIVANF